MSEKESLEREAWRLAREHAQLVTVPRRVMAASVAPYAKDRWAVRYEWARTFTRQTASKRYECVMGRGRTPDAALQAAAKFLASQEFAKALRENGA